MRSGSLEEMSGSSGWSRLNRRQRSCSSQLPLRAQERQLVLWSARIRSSTPVWASYTFLESVMTSMPSHTTVEQAAVSLREPTTSTMHIRQWALMVWSGW